ncbi:hypothetical protein DBR06_SOUSAS42010007, partial [Sousa chinensis]
ESPGPIILDLFGLSAFKGSGWDLPFLSSFGGARAFLRVWISPRGVMGLKESPNHIQEPLWIFSQPLTMTFPVTQIRS